MCKIKNWECHYPDGRVVVDTRKINYLMVISWMLFVIFLIIFAFAYYILLYNVNVVTFHEPIHVVTNPVKAGTTIEYSMNRTKHIQVSGKVFRVLWCKVPKDGMQRFSDTEPFPSAVPVGLETDARGYLEIPLEAGGSLCKILWHADYKINDIKTAYADTESGWFEVEK